MADDVTAKKTLVRPSKSTRKDFSKAVETEILLKCKRICALCFGFKNDRTQKRGQLAHIDRNKANSSRDNAAFLCTPHHDEYDIVSKQTKRITPEELKAYQQQLCALLDSPALWPSIHAANNTRKHLKSRGISLEVYDRRLPTYKTTIRFLRDVQKDLRPDLQEVLKFAADTEEALFLFDENIANYLSELLKRALRLRAVALMLGKDYTSSLMEEETELSLWFSAQFEETRRRFAPFLRLTA